MTDPERTPTLTLDDALSALRAAPYGGMDDAARGLRLAPAIQATVSPVITAMRWGSTMFGMIYAATRASAGDGAVVVTLAAVLFLTTWRTLRPIRLGSMRQLDRGLAFSDAALVGVAVGLSGGFESPFAFSLLAVAAVAAFGWGVRSGLAALAVGAVALGFGTLFGSAPFNPFDLQVLALVGSFVVTTLLAGLGRDRLIDAEKRRQLLAGRIDQLLETNDLLSYLNQVARTLPMSLDLREALGMARSQIRDAFDARVVALLVCDDASGEWVPYIADGCALGPSSSVEDLPPALRMAVGSDIPIVVRDTAARAAPQPLGRASKSGIYTTVRARGRTLGVLGVEHPEAGRYAARDARLFDIFSDIVALTVDNARSFSRLRTLGADAERTRIARDLHDRLGQYLTFISIELERIIGSSDGPNGDLQKLHGDVHHALDELRETLRQLRSSVSEGRSLAVAARDLVTRFNDRGPTLASLTVADPTARLPVPIENELLRILQEALSNVAKHANAKNVAVTWAVNEDRGLLTIADDGCGFNTANSVRDAAYGLVGMRERADLVGARLLINSEPGQGTTITISAGLAFELGEHRPSARRSEDVLLLDDEPVEELAMDEPGATSEALR